MTEGLVSIITPCYNCEKYLQRYIDRIKEQTYKKLQLIFVNDGSKDSTEEIVERNRKLLEDEGYIVTYKYQKNRGLGGAINTGIKLIEGEFFTWCDSDNFLTNDYVETKVNFFRENPQYAVVRCDGYIVIDPEIDKPVSKLADGNSDKFKEDLFWNALMVNNFHFGCAMIRTENFDKVNPKREIYESREGQNWQLLLPVFYSFKSGYIDKPMFYFVNRADSISNVAFNTDNQAQIRQLEEYVKILHETVKSMGIPEEEECLKKVDAKYAKQCFYLSDRNNREQLDGYYNRLKELGELTGQIKFRYWGEINPVCRLAVNLARAVRYSGK